MQELRVFQQPEGQPQLDQDVGEQHVEPLAVGQLDDALVELHVGRAHAQPVAGVAAFQRHLDRLAHVLLGGVARVGLRQRLALDEPAHAVDVDDRRDARHRHEHAAVRRVLEQAFLGQRAEHLAQGVARNLQAVGQRGLRQPLPRRELALHDLLADQLGHAVVERERAGGRRGGGSGGIQSGHAGRSEGKREGRSEPAL
ncbi:hypothetical protein D9M69_572180 [compost metagenome]